MVEGNGPGAPRGRVSGRWGRIPWHTFLFAAYPVLFLYAGNVGEVNVADVVLPLVVLQGIALAAVALLTLVFRDARRAGIVVSALLVGVLLFERGLGVLRSLLPRGADDALFDSPSLLLLVAVVALAVGVAWRIRGRLGALTTGLNVVAVVLVVLTLVEVAPDVARGVRTQSATEDQRPIVVGGRTTQRDIYYLVFDRYGSERSIGSLFGITDNDLDEWLTERGFQVLPDAHANYVSTTLSLGSTLNVDMLSELLSEDRTASADFQGVFDLLQENRVGRFLKEQGYEYVQIGGWFGPTRSARMADLNLNPDVVSDFVAALLDMSALPAMARALGQDFESTDVDRHAEAARFQFDTLEQVVGRPGPTFTFAHILMPHPPYVFLEDGTFVGESSPGARATYATQLRYTNDRIRAIVEPLLALPEDERPIIIIQADEGPYPRRNSELRAADWANATGDELEQKFGILSAFLLPGDPEAGTPLPRSLSSVNTFRMVLGRYFGADLPLLPDRSWVSKKGDPFDMTEITDRLPSLADPAG